MNRNSTQKWTFGSTVKVGFLTLVVKAAIATSEAARAIRVAQASARFNEIFA